MPTSNVVSASLDDAGAVATHDGARLGREHQCREDRRAHTRADEGLIPRSRMPLAKARRYEGRLS